jgi:hypothetical protein
MLKQGRASASIHNSSIIEICTGPEKNRQLRRIFSFIRFFTSYGATFIF